MSQLASRVGERGGVRHMLPIPLHFLALVALAGRGGAFPPLGANPVSHNSIKIVENHLLSEHNGKLWEAIYVNKYFCSDCIYQCVDYRVVEY
jgi:hypothetical protein